MADTYAKLLGLADTSLPQSGPEKVKSETNKQPDKAAADLPTKQQAKKTNSSSKNNITSNLGKKEAVKIHKQNASMPESQYAGIPENKHASMPVVQNSGNLEILHTRTPTEKVTYRFHPEGKYAIEDIKTILSRKFGIKVSYELIAEAAILSAYEDLLENQHASKLAKRLPGMPESQKSS